MNDADLLRATAEVVAATEHLPGGRTWRADAWRNAAANLAKLIEKDAADRGVPVADTLSRILEPFTEPVITLTAAQLREWAGLDRDLTADELEQIDECIPNSSIPDAIGTIATDALGLS